MTLDLACVLSASLPVLPQYPKQVRPSSVLKGATDTELTGST